MTDHPLSSYDVLRFGDRTAAKDKHRYTLQLAAKHTRGEGGREMRKLCLGAMALVLVLASCGQLVAPSADLEDRISRVENGLLLTQSIEERMEFHNVPGVSIAVINDFEVEWTRGYGVLELGGNEPVTPDTLFQAGSVSKPVTAVGALHYVEQGPLDLDENVNDRLESWQIPENEFTAQADVTLHGLLSHTAGVNQGLNRGYAPGEEVPTLQQALEGVPPANSIPVRVVRVPGTEEHYSNGGFLVVVQLLEDVLDKPFTEAMEEAVFEPIGMASSTFEQTLPAEDEARAAVPHGWDAAAWRESPGLVGETHVHDPGYSGLWTSAPDLALFGAEIMRACAGESETVLSQEMAELMLTPVAEGIPLQEPFDADQALGFSLLHLGQETWFVHFGGSFPGFISVLLAQPERGFGVVIMTNSWSGDALIWEIFYSLFYAYGIFPTTGQILGMGYSLVLFLAALLLWPVGYVARRARPRKAEGEEAELKQGRVATIARIVAMLTVTAILVLSLLYRGPLAGDLVHSLDRGETVLTKALLGIFFSTPIFLVILTVLVWKNRYWSTPERVQYTLIALGALVGIFLLRDLWPLMFWG
jgi:CubicO group peptidase (beta-lactamase class C family)